MRVVVFLLFVAPVKSVGCRLNLIESEQIKGCWIDRNGNVKKVFLKWDKFVLWKVAEAEKEFMEPFRSVKVSENKHEMEPLYRFVIEGLTEKIDNEVPIFDTTLDMISGCVWIE